MITYREKGEPPHGLLRVFQHKIDALTTDNASLQNEVTYLRNTAAAQACRLSVLQEKLSKRAVGETPWIKAHNAIVEIIDRRRFTGQSAEAALNEIVSALSLQIEES